MKLKGTGREYYPVSKMWVFVYVMYMIGVITTTLFFVTGWILFI